ncbi:hypothetical protein PIB30_056066 [Stylosanthes scabra]|uniref:Ubiquitin-like protease family profile domain-containing protein n=1 Tax=Stylosanthes scabra TaxID=79078 RepID=A0ABU6QIU8_9FABA|nr:hypothetical protein [Stylosanthes scabra]
MAQRAFDESFEKISDKITTWCLPPQFGIYVPLIDNFFHWFLMVISIDEGKVYKLDSYPDPGRDIQKNSVMGWTVSDGFFPDSSNDNSQVWLLELMAMEDMFRPNLTTTDINSDNQLHHNKASPSNILDDLVGCMKSDIVILQVAVLNNEDHQTVPKERSEEHVPDKGKKVIKDNAPLEEDTHIFLGGSDPEDMALKTTIAQRASDETFEEISDKITTWSLPPQFENDDFAVWLLKWMAMEDMFQPNLTTRPLDAQIQMLAACANLTENHNEICHIVKNRSAARWKSLVGN